MSYQTIFDSYRVAGMSEAGALAMLGNLDAESNCVSIRLQGDFSAGYQKSREYTEKVDRGIISREDFIYHGPSGGGYGLAMWTFQPRKRDLYDTAKAAGKSIGDETLQVDFSITELKSDFTDLWHLLCTSADLYELTKQVCYRFENPAVKNVNARYQLALRIEGLVSLAQVEVAPPKPVYWPPRTVDKGMSGADVAMLQAILIARGYYVAGISSEVDDATDQAIGEFQRDHNLQVDRVCGPMTWAELKRW